MTGLMAMAKKRTEAALMKPGDAAKFLSISERTLWSLKESGEIPHVRVGERSVRYSRLDLLSWIERSKTNPVAVLIPEPPPMLNRWRVYNTQKKEWMSGTFQYKRFYDQYGNKKNYGYLLEACDMGTFTCDRSNELPRSIQKAVLKAKGEAGLTPTE